MGAIRQIIDALARIFGVSLPPWEAPLVLLVLALLLSPWIRTYIRSTDARKLLAQAARTRGAEREALERQAFELVKGRPAAVLALAIEAVNQGRTELAGLALTELRRARAYPFEVARLEGVLRGPSPPTALDAVMLVERLLENGLSDEAHRRWKDARARWPQDAELAALSTRWASEAAGMSGPG